MLPPCVRVIQGDGISRETLDKILKKITNEQWSAENLVFGSGGALLQKLNRDTLKCAYKCSFAVVDGKPVGGLCNLLLYPVSIVGGMIVYCRIRLLN